MLGDGARSYEHQVFNQNFLSQRLGRASAILAATLTTGAVLWPNEGFCWSCAPKSCYSDFSCDAGCWCYKKGISDGTCVPK